MIDAGTSSGMISSGPSSSPPSAFQRLCGASIPSIVVQLIASVVFVALGLWVGTIALETTRITGITTVPPGLLYAYNYPPPPPS